MSSLRNYIVPEVFSPAVSDMANEVSRILASGGVVQDGMISGFMGSAGSQFEMPVFDALDGKHAFNVSSVDPSQMASIVEHSSGSEIIVKLDRNLHVGATKFMSALASGDPIQNILSQTANIIAAHRQTVAVNHLAGLMGGALAGNVVPVEEWSVDVLAEVEGIWGHFTTGEGTLLVNSADLVAIRKEGLMSYEGVSPTTGQTLKMPVVAGYRVVVDNTVPAGKIFVLRDGAVGFGSANLSVSVYEDEKGGNGAGTEIVRINDAGFGFHVYGTSYVGSGVNPTDTVLGTAGTWEARADLAKIGVAMIDITGPVVP